MYEMQLQTVSQSTVSKLIEAWCTSASALVCTGNKFNNKACWPVPKPKDIYAYIEYMKSHEP